jgi:3-hydroxyisobutyrate dehydrogenase-like beta-hydroxyacid dehydrogenase
MNTTSNTANTPANDTNGTSASADKLPPTHVQRIGLLGFGEVGSIVGAALAARGLHVQAWDKLMPASPGMQQAAQAAGVAVVTNAEYLGAGAQLVISAVTASNTLAAATSVASHLAPGTFYLDLNSASPGTKQACAAAIEAAGAHYVEAGVMTSVPPYGMAVPMLLGGAHAQQLCDVINAWGAQARVVSPELGVASAIKMCRSIMIKGLEALVIESYTTARSYGVEDHVLPTLAETFPSIDWSEQGRYFFSRVAQHGQRRAEEMRESAVTVQETGIGAIMASAIADKQQWVANAKRDGVFANVPKDAPWQAYADALIAARQADLRG